MNEWVHARELEKAKCNYDKTSIVQKTDTMTIRKTSKDRNIQTICKRNKRGKRIIIKITDKKLRGRYKEGLFNPNTEKRAKTTEGVSL